MASSGNPSRKRARTYLKLIGLAAMVGIPAALLASVFSAAVSRGQELLWIDFPRALGQDRPPWYLVVGLPVVGGVIVWVARRFLPGDGGHSPLGGINASPTRWQHGLGVALAAFGTLAFGAVLGPEAPLIALGSVVGMAVNSLVKLGEREQGVIATAGSFSAVSALFGGPLVAGILLLEAGLSLGSALVPALLPGLVAAAVGYVLFIGFDGWGGLDAAGQALPGLPAYEEIHVFELLSAVVVGGLVAVVMAHVHRLAHRVDRLCSGRMFWGLVGGGLVVGVIAQATQLVGGDSKEILFSGQQSLPEVVTQGLGVLLVVIVAKGLGYAVSLGCGFRGGPVFPAIFIGVAISSIAVATFDVSVTWAITVGAAAGMTAGTGLLFSSLLFSLLLTGKAGTDALPAAVLAAVAAWLIRAFLERGAAGPPEPNTS
jgi:H+/Cl- antiporter ClcA